MISKRIMLLEKYRKFEQYRASCSCGDIDHDIIIEFDGGNTISFILNIQNCIDEENFIKRIYKKIKICYNILFKGGIEASHEFILDDKKQIEDFISIFNNYFKDFKND